MEKMHVENEQKKNEEDQRKAKEMEAMHATEEQKKAEEHKQAADAMEVQSRYFLKVEPILTFLGHARHRRAKEGRGAQAGCGCNGGKYLNFSFWKLNAF
jgi:hypothetical protein